jgi:hypothetical protein
MNTNQLELNFKEIWVPNPFDEKERHLVSSIGRIKNKKTNKILKQSLTTYKRKNKNGTVKLLAQYYQIKLNKINYAVHRLVLTAFKGPPPKPDMQCSHINGNPLDNRIENLEWSTASDNNKMKKIHGTIPYQKGEKNAFAKLKDSDVLYIKYLLYKNLKLKEIAEKFNIHFSTVSLIKLNKKWTHISLSNDNIETFDILKHY